MKGKYLADLKSVFIILGKLFVATLKRTWLHQLKLINKSDRFAQQCQTWIA
jgi:hypothetical protein